MAEKNKPTPPHKPGENENQPAGDVPDGGCDPGGAPDGKGKRKPECPDGYPSEQPKKKEDAEAGGDTDG